MSYDRIVELLTAAQLEDAQTARTLRVQADDLAADTKPGVVHPDHGYGAIVGVTKDGDLEVAFGGDPFAVAVPIDHIREAP